METLCRKFIESRDSPDKKLRERVERETMVAFDIILEVITSVFMLEPFRPSQVRGLSPMYPCLSPLNGVATYPKLWQMVMRTKTLHPSQLAGYHSK